MRHKMILRLKSGRELRFTCDEYKINRLRMTGDLTGFDATNAHGECPIYFDIDDVEAIIEVRDKEEQGMSDKPIVFNYREYEKLKEELDRLRETSF